MKTALTAVLVLTSALAPVSAEAIVMRRHALAISIAPPNSHSDVLIFLLPMLLMIVVVCLTAAVARASMQAAAGALRLARSAIRRFLSGIKAEFHAGRR